MARIATVIGVVVLVGLVACIGYMFWANPVNEKRERLAQELATIEPVEVEFEKTAWDYEGWQDAIAAKPALWTELVPPPPPPPPRPEPPPNLEAMIRGVKALRAGIGKKAKIVTPKDPKGSFMGVGDVVGGLTIKDVTKTSVILGLTWKDQELTTTLPRE